MDTGVGDGGCAFALYLSFDLFRLHKREYACFIEDDVRGPYVTRCILCME